MTTSLACGGPASHVAAPASPLDALRWMAGDWEGKSPDGMFDEHWLEPRGGVMLGAGREIKLDGTLSFFEYMRIESRPDGVYLVPQPHGKPGHDFKLVTHDAARAVFENAGDDRVHRISYSHSGDTLEARVQGDGIDDSFHLARKSPLPK